MVILDGTAQDQVDLTSMNVLISLVKELQAKGVAVAVCDVHAPVLAYAREMGLVDLIGPERVFPTVELAVRGMEKAATGLPPQWPRQGQTSRCRSEWTDGSHGEATLSGYGGRHAQRWSRCYEVRPGSTANPQDHANAARRGGLRSVQHRLRGRALAPGPRSGHRARRALACPHGAAMGAARPQEDDGHRNGGAADRTGDLLSASCWAPCSWRWP